MMRVVFFISLTMICESGNPLLAAPPQTYTSIPKTPADVPMRRASPLGTVEVAFESPPPLVVTDPDNPGPVTTLQQHRYQVAFYTPGTNTAIAVAPFTDVYGTKQAPKASTPDQLYKQLYWSPDEDFVILPQERSLPSVPRTAPNAISLNKSFVWQIVAFPLELAPLVWIDSTHPVGNVRAGCRWEVSRFDGPLGIISPVNAGSQIEGYRIVEVRERQIVMQKYLSECASAQETRAFHADCMAYDVSFLRREIIACPD